MNPNTRQPGGDHYMKAGAHQHWDMLPALGFGWEYYIGSATKYLTRVKQPDLDPAKAGHYIDKLIWLIEEGKVPAEFNTTSGKRLNIDLGRDSHVDVAHHLDALYYRANGISESHQEAIRMLMQARTLDDLRAARDKMRLLEPAQDPVAAIKPGVPAPPPPPGPGPKPGDTVPRDKAEDQLIPAAQAGTPAPDGTMEVPGPRPAQPGGGAKAGGLSANVMTTGNTGGIGQ